MLRRHRWFAEWIGNERDECCPDMIPWPDSYRITEKISDLELIVDRRDAENLRDLFNDMLANWPARESCP